MADDQLINVIDPLTQEIGSVSSSQLPGLTQQGYVQASPDQVNAFLRKQEYDTLPQQGKAFLEGAAESASFGLSSGVEKALGVKPEAMQARREENPISHGLGTAAGLGAGMLTGSGEAAILEKAGEVAAKGVAKVIGEQTLGRVGSAGAKAAVEGMLMASGDEVSKMFIEDPHQTVETAAANVGLSGLLGAGLGAGLGGASELWKLGPGKKLDAVLNTLKNRSAGMPRELAEAANIEIPREVMAALGDNEPAKRMFQTVIESNTKAGAELQNSLAKFRNEASESAMSALGKTSKDIDELAMLSDYDRGLKVKESLSNEIKQMAGPVLNKYEEFSTKFKKVPVTNDVIADMSQKISTLAIEKGYSKAESEAAMGLVNRVLGKLPKQQTAEDLRIFASNLGKDHPFGKETYDAAKGLRRIIDDSHADLITSNVTTKAPEMLGDYEATKSAYKGLKDMFSDLNDRLHTGKQFGTESFLRNISEMEPEALLKRLSPKGDVELQNLLEQKFPEVTKAMRDVEISKLLKGVEGKDTAIDLNKLFKRLDNLSPEMRQFIMPPGSEQQLNAIRELTSKIPEKMKFTDAIASKISSRLFEHMPAAAAGIAAMIFGHNPAIGLVLGELAHHVGKEAPAKLKLSLLKFLASDKPINAEAFHAMTKLSSAVERGELLLNKGVNHLFDSGADFSLKIPVQAREDLKKKVDQVAAHPEQAMEWGGSLGHYTPEHSSALAYTAAKNMQYLSTLRPDRTPMGILEAEKQPDAIAEARYNRALDIAETPLIILKSVKDGSITPADMQHLQQMFPSLYQRINSKIGQQLIDHKAEGGNIPYATKLGMSIFMQQPLDSSMTPASIQSTQSIVQPAQMMQQQQQMQQASQPTRKLERISKVPSLSATPDQSREAARSTGHK